MTNETVSQAAVRTIRMSDDQIEQLLDRLDLECAAPGAEPASGEYRYRRKGLIVDMLQPGAVTPTRYVVQPRRISEPELWFLHGSFLHTGTRCTVQLVSLHGTWTSVPATVAFCAYVQENIHSVCVRFAHRVDPALYCAEAGRTRVLLVEDDDGLARLAEFHLSQLNADVDRIKEASRAAELAAKDRFDLILMDVDMQKEEGFEVVKALRDTGYSRPIVAFTGLTGKTDQGRCTEAGFDRVLTKPFTREDVGSLLKSLRQEPLFSSFYDDPSMVELINKFVEELPEKVRRIEESIASEQIDTLISLVRSLRSLGSSYGFDILTETASAVEAKLSAGGSIEDVRTDAHSLIKLCLQARGADLAPND